MLQGKLCEGAIDRSDPIPVLFIGGAGRSGSTLLDRVIGMQNGFCSVGEGHFVWKRSFEQNQLCGCGEPFHDCAFWEEVSQRAYRRATTDFDIASASRLKAVIDGKRALGWLLLGRGPRRFTTSFCAYADLLERLYAAVRDVSGQRVVVDSSKDARHGIVLSRMPGVELHVVHLIRDPRAVAFSWKRQRRRPEIHWKAEDMPVEGVVTSCSRWITQNALVELLSSSAQSYHRVRYEDFLATPTETLAQILSPLDWVDADGLSLDPGALELRPSHTLSGNPMRFKKGRIQLRLDDEWKTGMAPLGRWTATAITAPLLARYGYPFRIRAGG